MRPKAFCNRNDAKDRSFGVRLFDRQNILRPHSSQNKPICCAFSLTNLRYFWFSSSVTGMPDILPNARRWTTKADGFLLSVIFSPASESAA